MGGWFQLSLMNDQIYSIFDLEQKPLVFFLQKKQNDDERVKNTHFHLQSVHAIKSLNPLTADFHQSTI